MIVRMLGTSQASAAQAPERESFEARFSWLLGGNLKVYVNGDLRGSVAYTTAPALPRR